jgi:phosphate transport system substrate-binding protein
LTEQNILKNRMKRAFSIALYLSALLAFPASAEALRVGGTGSAEPLLQRLFEEFSRQAPEASFKIISPPLGSGGGIKALLAGRADLVVIARPLRAEEAALLGRQFVLADTPFIVATHGGQRRNGFTFDELAQVYEGRLLTWEGGKTIRLVLRIREDGDTVQLKALSPALDKAVGNADRRPGMVYGHDDMDTLEILTRTPGSLGPTSLGLLRTTASQLSVLALNGITPSLTSMKNGSYPWRKTLTVVLPVKADPAAEKFADFLRSAKAGEILLRYEYLPARP